jgi:TetR/AcrR family transcriptional regulator, lmrAB and yxaGH operons repressor
MDGLRRTRASGRVTRDAFIASTGRLLRRQGYAATGLNEIVGASGAPRGSLYFHFPGGKEQLAAAAMERAGEELRGAIAAVIASRPRAAESLGVLIDGLGTGLAASGFRDGCPIATVTLEAAGASETVRLAAERVFGSWLQTLEQGLKADGLDDEQAARRALLVLSAIEGALLLSRARRDLAPLEAVRDELAALAG